MSPTGWKLKVFVFNRPWWSSYKCTQGERSSTQVTGQHKSPLCLTNVTLGAVWGVSIKINATKSDKARKSIKDKRWQKRTRPPLDLVRKRPHDMGLSRKKVGISKKNFRKLQIGLGRSLPFYHCHSDFRIQRLGRNHLSVRVETFLQKIKKLKKNSTMMEIMKMQEKFFSKVILSTSGRHCKLLRLITWVMFHQLFSILPLRIIGEGTHVRPDTSFIPWSSPSTCACHNHAMHIACTFPLAGLIAKTRSCTPPPCSSCDHHLPLRVQPYTNTMWTWSCCLPDMWEEDKKGENRWGRVVENLWLRGSYHGTK